MRYLEVGGHGVDESWPERGCKVEMQLYSTKSITLSLHLLSLWHSIHHDFVRESHTLEVLSLCGVEVLILFLKGVRGRMPRPHCSANCRCELLSWRLSTNSGVKDRA